MLYTPQVIEHFTNPRNMGKMDNPDGEGTAGNIACGDEMKMFIRVGKLNGNEIIEDIKFNTLGCAAAIATSSMITELAKGKTLENAMEVGRSDVADNLGGLTPIKMHCSNMAADALHRAIEDYRSRNK